jgi:biopolymer transport protein ExbB
MKTQIAAAGLPALLACLLMNTALAQEETPAAAPPQPAVPAVNPAHALDQLEAAYQKEYAFLEAQLRELRTRSTDFEAQAARDETARQGQIERMETEWVALQSQVERLQKQISDAGRELESVDDARTTLEATFLQAESTLEPYAISELASDAYRSAPDGQRIGMVFGHAIAQLRSGGTRREVPGSFFQVDGSEAQGKLLRLGNVAAYGISERGNGALAPAGEGRLKVWSEPATETATALAAGRSPDVLGMFLFETESRAIEETAGKTILGVIASGGTIGWIIVALGIFALVLTVLRFMFLRGASAATGKIVDAVGAEVRQGHLDAALKTCKEFKGATARVVGAAVRNLDRDRAHLEDIISEAILHESAHLNRFGAIILVIAAVAPLLGLLGTVTGMITTFDIITEFGTGDPKLLSGGISIALVTTELGLAVAIPALLIGNVLSGWSESIKDDMEKGALRVINQYKEHRRTA